VIECVDPVFLRTVSRAGAHRASGVSGAGRDQPVNGFHALGTLLASA